MMSPHTTFVTNLERRREQARLTKNEMIARAGIGTSSYYEILRGDVSPTLQTIEALARAVGATLCELFAPPPPAGFRIVTVALPPQLAFSVERQAAEARAQLIGK